MASQLYFLLRLSLFTCTKAKLAISCVVSFWSWSTLSRTLTLVRPKQWPRQTKGFKQLVISKTSRGVNYLSNWDIKEVAMRKTLLPDQSMIPKLLMAMEEIMKKKKTLVKTAATKAVKAFLIAGNHKMGKDSFPCLEVLCWEGLMFSKKSCGFLFWNVSSISTLLYWPFRITTFWFFIWN